MNGGKSWGEMLDEINALKAENERLREALTECADELETEIDARFKDSSGHVHGAMQGRYKRDMATVKRARAALGGKG
jgi:regulator of replication initiation timing